ncbi:MAG TPA: ferredoxin [Candidatus Woesebacteria bacterium]|nr:ferredoxin [Candidatus Woesebacteria bacterium]
MSDQLKDPANPHGPVVVRNLKFHVDKDLCIGAATCVAIAPNTFLLDSEAKAIILDTAEQDTDDTIIDAARGCPTAAIIVEDTNGNRIFP